MTMAGSVSVAGLVTTGVAVEQLAAALPRVGCFVDRQSSTMVAFSRDLARPSLEPLYSMAYLPGEFTVVPTQAGVEIHYTLRITAHRWLTGLFTLAVVLIAAITLGVAFGALAGLVVLVVLRWWERYQLRLAADFVRRTMWPLTHSPPSGVRNASGAGSVDHPEPMPRDSALV